MSWIGTSRDHVPRKHTALAEEAVDPMGNRPKNIRIAKQFTGDGDVSTLRKLSVN